MERERRERTERKVEREVRRIPDRQECKREKVM